MVYLARNTIDNFTSGKYVAMILSGLGTLIFFKITAFSVFFTLAAIRPAAHWRA